jgi:uncharacterized membrane protein
VPDPAQDRYATQWRVLDGIVATMGAILLVWSLIWGDWFGAIAAVVVGGSALYGAVTGTSILKCRYKKVD